jgi:hypothetical protein
MFVLLKDVYKHNEFFMQMLWVIKTRELYERYAVFFNFKQVLFTRGVGIKKPPALRTVF